MSNRTPSPDPLSVDNGRYVDWPALMGKLEELARMYQDQLTSKTLGHPVNAMCEGMSTIQLASTVKALRMLCAEGNSLASKPGRMETKFPAALRQRMNQYGRRSSGASPAIDSVE